MKSNPFIWFAPLIVAVLCTTPGALVAAPATGPLMIHPDNPRYFADGTKSPDGSLKAVYLTGAHTWNNLVDMGKSDPPEQFDYGGYLGLDALLVAGEPRTTVPDERAFIATHQLIEVGFRLMIADLATVAATLAALTPDLAVEPLPGDAGPSPFWRPALTASARLRHTAREVLPAAHATGGG